MRRHPSAGSTCYGYIRHHADTVERGRRAGFRRFEGSSQGLATVLAAYRDVAVDSYYAPRRPSSTTRSPTPPGRAAPTDEATRSPTRNARTELHLPPRQ
jgi:hypothetical protein